MNVLCSGANLCTNADDEIAEAVIERFRGTFRYPRNQHLQPCFGSRDCLHIRGEPLAEPGVEGRFTIDRAQGSFPHRALRAHHRERDSQASAVHLPPPHTNA